MIGQLNHDNGDITPIDREHPNGGHVYFSVCNMTYGPGVKLAVVFTPHGGAMKLEDINPDPGNYLVWLNEDAVIAMIDTLQKQLVIMQNSKGKK